jgi:hypothetical protein
MVAPYVNNIAGALQHCASSSSYFFQASDSSSIQTAMQFFSTALQQAAHLSRQAKHARRCNALHLTGLATRRDLPQSSGVSASIKNNERNL